MGPLRYTAFSADPAGGNPAAGGPGWGAAAAGRLRRSLAPDRGRGQSGTPGGTGLRHIGAGRPDGRRDWTTIDLVHRESALVFHARNPFPPAGVFEDPATGAAAAAFGGYLRELRLVPTPATVTVHRGGDMGRPSPLTVTIPARSGIAVTGAAVALS